jgi:hypothetical protein
VKHPNPGRDIEDEQTTKRTKWQIPRAGEATWEGGATEAKRGEGFRESMVTILDTMEKLNR